MNIKMINPQTKVVKEEKVGFSWTVLFFGFFVPLFRGDWKWFLIMIIAASCTLGISSIIFCFIYNKIYINELLSKGYIAADEGSKQVLINKGFIVSDASTYSHSVQFKLEVISINCGDRPSVWFD